MVRACSCLFVALGCGFLCSAAPARADLSGSRRTAIVTAVEAVLPATVTIGAERVEVHQVNPFRSLHDDFFSDWFSDPFFGGLRRAVRVKSLGSGILVDKRGWILTNDHVVSGAQEILVTLSDGRIFPAKLKGRGVPLDLALLEIVLPKGESVDLPSVTLGTADDLALGEWAIAIGAPSNLEASVTAGVISAVGRRLPTKQDYKYLGMIQTDASINPGNSGGPLVNADGKIIGINTVIISQSGGSEGLGFAIPADQAKKVLDDLAESGEVRFAWFGWELSESKEEDGLVVQSVHPGGEASTAGILTGAVVRAINSKPIRTVEDYEKMLLAARIGQSIAVRVAQGGTERVMRLTARMIPEELIRVYLGLTVADVSVRYRRLYGGGVVVTDLDPDGAIAKLLPPPIQPGDVILSIDGRRVDSVESYKSSVLRLKKKTVVEIEFRRGTALFSFTFHL